MNTPREEPKGEWDPFREVHSYYDKMNRVFDGYFGRLPARRTFQDGVWIPLADLIETAKAVVVRVEVPGVKKEDIRIALSEGTLLISGERRSEDEERGKTYHRIERSFGLFQRVLPLPPKLHFDKVKAVYRDGVLTVTLPKSAKSTQRSVRIAIE
jgi:HSP20 family protein